MLKLQILKYQKRYKQQLSYKEMLFEEYIEEMVQ